MQKVKVVFDVAYSGGLQLALDVTMKNGWKATISVLLSQIEGPLLFDFSRTPCTHWSVAFTHVRPWSELCGQ